MDDDDPPKEISPPPPLPDVLETFKYHTKFQMMPLTPPDSSETVWVTQPDVGLILTIVQTVFRAKDNKEHDGVRCVAAFNESTSYLVSEIKKCDSMDWKRGSVESVKIVEITSIHYDTQEVTCKMNSAFTLQLNSNGQWNTHDLCWTLFGVYMDDFS